MSETESNVTLRKDVHITFYTSYMTLKQPTFDTFNIEIITVHDNLKDFHYSFLKLSYNKVLKRKKKTLLHTFETISAFQASSVFLSIEISN